MILHLFETNLGHFNMNKKINNYVSNDNFTGQKTKYHREAKINIQIVVNM